MNFTLEEILSGNISDPCIAAAADSKSGAGPPQAAGTVCDTAPASLTLLAGAAAVRPPISAKNTPGEFYLAAQRVVGTLSVEPSAPSPTAETKPQLSAVQEVAVASEQPQTETKTTPAAVLPKRRTRAARTRPGRPAAVVPAPDPAVPPPPKKKPGRPRKVSNDPAPDIMGVVDEAVTAGDVLELVYCSPVLFKKMLQVFKAYTVPEIEFCFSAQGARIIAKDHTGKAEIFVQINGDRMNLYFCHRPFRISVKRDSLERAFSSVTADSYKISLISKENTHRSAIYLIVNNKTYNNDDQFDIDVVFKDDGPIAVEPDVSDYPIQFVLDAKHFKKKIADIYALSDTFTIRKDENNILQFTFDRARTVNWTGVYRDTSKMQLRDTTAPGEVFSASVKLDDYVRPFAMSNAGNDVHIAADRFRKMAFAAHLDVRETKPAIYVKVFAEIKNYT